MDHHLANVRFLIVEDHQFQRLMLEQALAALGAATIHCAGDGAQAMRILRNPGTPVDVVITDLMMPDVDGIEFIALLKNAALDIALILTSADEAVLLTAAAIAQGHGVPLLGTLRKPLTPDRLRPLLERYVAQRAGAPGS